MTYLITAIFKIHKYCNVLDGTRIRKYIFSTFLYLWWIIVECTKLRLTVNSGSPESLLFIALSKESKVTV